MVGVSYSEVGVRVYAMDVPVMALSVSGKLFDIIDKYVSGIRWSL